jgi:hypothetical protein
MKKQFLIQVELGDRSRFIQGGRNITGELQRHAELVVAGATEGTLPKVTVIECVDAKDENLADFAKKA